MLNRLFDNFSDKTNKSIYHTDTQNRQQDDKKHIKYSSSKHSTFFYNCNITHKKADMQYFFICLKT